MGPICEGGFFVPAKMTFGGKPILDFIIRSTSSSEFLLSTVECKSRRLIMVTDGEQTT